MILVSKMNFVLSQGHLEHPKGISMTVPDETLSIKEILQRFVRGQPLDIHFRPTFNIDESDFDSVDYMEAASLELAERSELLESLREENRELREKLKPKSKPVAKSSVEPTEVVTS